MSTRQCIIEVMTGFNFPPMSSEHSPQDIWEALGIPLSPELNRSVNSPKARLRYERLDANERIQKGTRFVYSPNTSELGIFLRQCGRLAPDEGTGTVDVLSGGDKTRIDVVNPGQIARGHMRYRVEEGEDGTGLLIVDGEFAVEGVAETLAKMWPDNLGDPAEWSITYGIRNPAQRFLEHIPAILASAAED